MEKNYYCLITLGENEDVPNILSHLINGKFHHLDLKKVFISTFESNFELGEIENLLIDLKKNFFLNKMSPTSFTAQIMDAKIDEDLFSDYVQKLINLNNNISQEKSENMDDSEYYDMRKDENLPPEDFFLKNQNDYEIFLNSLKNFKKRKNEPVPTIDDILDRISEVGLENLTEKEMDYLVKYSKN